MGFRISKAEGLHLVGVYGFCVRGREIERDKEREQLSLSLCLVSLLSPSRTTVLFWLHNYTTSVALLPSWPLACRSAFRALVPASAEWGLRSQPEEPETRLSMALMNSGV